MTHGVNQVRVYHQQMNPNLKEALYTCAIAVLVNQIFGMSFLDMGKMFAIGFIAKQVVEGHLWQLRVNAHQRMIGNH